MNSMFKKLKKAAKTFVRNEEGQGLTEYAILAALLVIAIIWIISRLGGTIGTKFQDIDKTLRNVKP